MNDSGFSLVEVLVALAVTAMIALSGTMLFQQSRRALEVSRATASEIQNAAMFHAALTHDLSHIAARPIALESVTSQNGLHLAGDAGNQTWTFVRSGRLWPGKDASVSDLVRVQYQVQRQGVVRTIWAHGQPVAGTSATRHTLLEDVENISIRYFADANWISEWCPERRDLPQAIEVSWENQKGQPYRQIFLVGSSR